MEYASKGLAGTALGFGIGGAALGLQTEGSAICWAASTRTRDRKPLTSLRRSSLP